MSAPAEVKTETRAVLSLRADPKNARRHSEQQIAKIAGSIERFGYVTAIAAQPDGTIIGGHATWQAVQRLGWRQVEVRVVAGLTPAQYRALGLALNKLPEGSAWDDGILGEVLGELDDAGEDILGLGFSDAEFKRLAEGADEIEVKEIETSEVQDEFWISIRGDLKYQAQALKALEEAMRPFPGVSVDLGTIAMG